MKIKMLASKPPRQFKCSICHQKYTKIEDIRAHIKATHLAHLTCPLCDRVFVNIIELNNHKKIHFQAVPDHLFQQNESICQASESKDKTEDKKPSSSSSKEDIEIDLRSVNRKVKVEDPTQTLNSITEGIDLESKLPTSQSTSNNQEEGKLIKSSRLNSKEDIEIDFPSNNRKVKVEDSTPSLNSNAEYVDQEIKFPTNQSTSNDREKGKLIKSSRLNNKEDIEIDFPSNNRKVKVEDSTPSLNSNAEGIDQEIKFPTNQSTSNDREKGKLIKSSRLNSKEDIEIDFPSNNRKVKVEDSTPSLNSNAEYVDQDIKFLTNQSTSNDREEGKLIKSSRLNSKEDIEIDFPSNYRKVKVEDSTPSLNSNAEGIDQEIKFPNNQSTSNDRKKGKLIKSSRLNNRVKRVLNKQEVGKIHLLGLENEISPEPFPHHRPDNANECAAVRSNEGREQITHRSSSSKKTVCFPSGSQWTVTAVSVTPEKAVASPEGEDECATEEGDSAVTWDEGSEAAVDAEERANKLAALHSIWDERPKALGDTLGVKCKNSTGKFYEESKNGADNIKNAKKICLQLNIDNKDFLVIPFKRTKHIRVPESKVNPRSDLTSLGASPSHNMEYPQQEREYVCNVCKNKYDDIASVRSHMKEAHVNHLMCLTCNEKFPSISEYLSHSNAHLNNPQPLQKDIKNYDEDAGEHSPGGLKTSDTTNPEIDGISPEPRVDKLSRLGKVKEYKCKLCHEKYLNISDMRTHIKKVHLPSLTCTICGKRFANKYILMAHTKSHPRNIPEDKNSSTDISLSPKQMSQEKVNSESEGRSGFNNCDAAINRESRTEGLICENECFKCDECNLYFDRESALQLHQKTHQNVLYKCGVCDFASLSKALVMQHLTEKSHSFLGEFNEDL